MNPADLPLHDFAAAVADHLPGLTALPQRSGLDHMVDLQHIDTEGRLTLSRRPYQGPSPASPFSGSCRPAKRTAAGRR